MRAVSDYAVTGAPPRFVSNITGAVGLPHHNSAFSRPVSVANTTQNINSFKPIDTAGLFTDY